MKRQERQHQIDTLMALVLFGAFAVCVLSVLLLGAKVYRGVTERDQESYDRRTCLQYVATRLRQADRAGAVTVEDFGGVDCLCFAEDYDGETYLTRVYAYEGTLRELFSARDALLEPDAGEPVLEVEELSFDLEDGLLKVSCTLPEGGEDTLYLSLRSEEAVK